MGRHNEAKTIKIEVLNLRLKIKGEEHPVTLRCKSSLGMTVTKQGKLQDAEILLVESGTAQKRLLGNDHPETITTMSRTANLYECLARRNEGGELYHEVFQASIRALGEAHPRTEARGMDLKRFESVRRNSETAVSLSTATLAPPAVKMARSLTVDMLKLTIVEEDGEEDSV
jgi:hypothetical protein